MKTTKNAYLAKLTEQIQMKSVKVGKNLEGTTPPSVFIGRWSYPKVYAGPMMSNQMGDTSIMDAPESWIGENKTQEEIINYRMNLVRGKQLIKIDDLENPFVEKLQDISLASKSTDAEANFKKRPTGASISDESKIAPEVSKLVAGTQDGAVKKKLKGTCFAFSIIASTPSIPKTLAIS